MTAADRLGRVRARDRYGYAAAILTGGLAVLAFLCAASGQGYPFGPNDPVDDMSLIRAVPAGVGAALLAGVLFVSMLIMLGMEGRRAARPGGAGRASMLALGWAAVVVLLFVVPDIRLLALVAYLPMLVVGAPFGWPDVDYSSIVTAPMAWQGVSVSAGVLVAIRMVRWQRGSRGACVACGRVHSRAGSSSRAATVGRWATGVAVAVPLLFAATRYAWMAGVPLGISDAAMRHLLDTDGRWRGGALATFAVIGAGLTLGLVQHWGEVFPRWVFRIGGRRVPARLAVIPAMVVAVLIMSAGLGLLSNTDILFGELGAQPWLVGIHALWPIWAIALGVAAYAYYLRRRGRCATCGSGDDELKRDDRRRDCA
ncbi:hypothetical protein ACIBD9_18165 [Micromonospora sp. NPDC050784]|uniref:hypothetical protein n=1 Tax=Micromonospora sp. NPDC050784 TaxID=3364281 RepID=UPI0037945C32